MTEQDASLHKLAARIVARYRDTTKFGDPHMAAIEQIRLILRLSISDATKLVDKLSN